MEFGEYLDILKDKIHWKTAIQGNDLTVYRAVNEQYFEQVTQAQCRIEVRKVFEKLPPGLVASLVTALQEDHERLIDPALFVDTRKRGIGFKNGFFDLFEGKLRPYRQNDFVLDPLPMTLPEKRDEKIEAYFEGVVREWVGPETASFFLNLLAYTLFVFPNHEQIWLNFFGQGSNGKSVCLAILEEILGYEKVIGCDLANLNRFSNATFEGKWLVIGRDSSEMVSEGATSFIKNYSGDFRSLVEKKGGASFDTVTAGKLIVSTNKLIKSKDRTFSWFRRIIPINFPNEFPRNPDFEKGLIKQAPYICRFLLHLAYCYYNNKIPVAKHLPQPVKELINETRWANDRVAAFCELYFYKEVTDERGVAKWELDRERVEGLHNCSMAQVYTIFCEWHCSQFGDMAVEPSLHSFGGQYGAFMVSEIGKRFNFVKTNQGRLLKFKGWE